MARVSEEQRRLLAENETDFQRRFDEIKALNDSLEHRITERTLALENAMRVLREQNGALRASLDEMARLRTDVLEAGALKELQHEIANPMTYVLANLEQLEGGARGATPTADLGELEGIVRDIRTGVDGIASVVAWFLDIYGPPGAEPTRYDVAAELGAAARYLAKRRAGSIELHVSAEPLFVPGRGRQLTQVFVNVLKNATEALDRGNVWVTAHASEGKAVVLIRDDGPGIAAAVLERVFEPGFTTKPAGKGSGLGLHISRRIVERHEGAITVTSQPGQGTTFRIELPLWASPSSASSRGTSPVA
jgi:signal transduction histidine kinase